MSKDELIQLLKDYKENKAKLNIKLKELKNCRIKLKHLELETNSTTSYGINQDIHSKNKISNKVLDKIEQNDTKRIELEAEIEELEKLLKDGALIELEGYTHYAYLEALPRVVSILNEFFKEVKS